MLNEFQFIESLRRNYSLTKIGDDCAVLPKDAETDLVITTDLLVEDVDFRREWTKPELLGHKALAVSLSDIAAMGAKPVWAMLSIGVPEAVWNTDFIEKFYQGWFALARKFKVELVGGDVSKTPDKIVIDSIAAGEVKKSHAVMRSGAKIGDAIFVSGELGGAAAGLELLESGVKFGENVYDDLLLRQLVPNSRTEIGQILGEKKLATAMIDLSDGISSDLTHLCRASKVGAKIYLEQIPFDRNLYMAAASASVKTNLALNGGEDFELLFTVSPANLTDVYSALKDFQIKKIGEIVDSAEGVNLVVEKSIVKLEAKGFKHFQS